jgi:colanic acid biosynthesis glycosyl transferase WcaI
MAHGLENVLEAAARLDHRKDLVFLFAGPGAARDGLIQEAKERNLTNVVFIPPQPKDSMPAIWSLCDVALIHLKDSPVFAEVIPSKIFEAMGMGLPVLIAAPAGEATEIVNKAGAGLIVPPEDANALIQAVEQFLDDPEFRTSAGRRSFAAASAYSRAFQAKAMMAALDAAVSGSGDRAAEQVDKVEPVS